MSPLSTVSELYIRSKQTNLEVLADDGRREEATQVVCISLLLSKGQSLVVVWVPQQIVPTKITEIQKQYVRYSKMVAHYPKLQLSNLILLEILRIVQYKHSMLVTTNVAKLRFTYLKIDTCYLRLHLTLKLAPNLAIVNTHMFEIVT